MKPEVEQSPWQLQEEWPRIRREYEDRLERILTWDALKDPAWQSLVRFLTFRSEAFMDRTGRHG